MNSFEQKKSSPIELINTNVFVNSDIFLEREKQAHFLNITYACEYVRIFFSKNFSLALFFTAYIFNILSSDKILKCKAVYKPFTTEEVYSSSKRNQTISNIFREIIPNVDDNEHQRLRDSEYNQII